MKDVFGKAITDYFNGINDADISVHSKDFEDDTIPVHYLFRDFSEMPKIEQLALQNTKSSVLDVGCGAGSHALYLQEQGHDVLAIDTSEGAITTCKRRGVVQARQLPFLEVEGTFDTIILLMNGTGIIGSLQEIPAFFDKLKSLLSKNGQVLIDSSDLIYLFDEDDLVQGYYGQMEYKLSYKSIETDWFNWLFLDKDNLNEEAKLHGFNCDIIYEGEHYDYLAKLTVQ
ncbi:class I SAM-dependent methyltransferase [Croceibacter atlanticus]|uniref:class I SAM-dependent methyltransferase n=1 Tax=Croceibacter atlanticus TaxID=313588 RepID=UPI001C5E887D|nr:class I SAM-dependent methyltransferase [Croceibacter atlanticus]MBW4968908.1 class I SAM-dependent methyltransferase [Croceibacter atlanticus]